jgi:1-acyl-sn-glycerol-3-phosphate acyltransferase
MHIFSRTLNNMTNSNKPSYPLGIVGEIFGRVWALWGLICFVVTMIIFMIPFFLACYFEPEPTKTRRFISFSRVWMAVFLNLIFCPLRIKGKEYFKDGETYIVVCNHSSLMDVPISSPGIPGGNKTIAKIEMAKVPVFGLLYQTGSVLVDRKSDSSRRESLTKMKEVLEMGLHMCIYPEGTRNKTDQPLKSFHDGAFRLAVTTEKSIVPAIIVNSKLAFPPSKSFFLWPCRMSMHFLEPVPVNADDNIQAVKEKVFAIMNDYIVSNQY